VSLGKETAAKIMETKLFLGVFFKLSTDLEAMDETDPGHTYHVGVGADRSI
jgi:hypothetical protein